jgi:hypothetical protein
VVEAAGHAVQPQGAAEPGHQARAALCRHAADTSHWSGRRGVGCRSCRRRCCCCRGSSSCCRCCC